VFPFRNESKTGGLPVMTLLIIALCTTIFTEGYFNAAGVFTARGLVPVDFMYAVFHPTAGLFKAGGMLVASFFMHGGPGHLLGNMWYLWLFGPPLEKRIGKFSFVILYF
jgi:membrane associated rhomboid family serine protease